jgi:hypothetical protein
MTINHAIHRKGFTLVELAIVLAVIAILFTGLYRLLSNGNAQAQDSAAADLQLQIINAAKSFLTSPDGQQYMGSKCPAGNCAALSVTAALPLPTTTPTTIASCISDVKASGPMNDAQAATWCSALPAGFNASTANSYNQTFQIQFVYNTATTTANTPPLTYSFIVKTKGGYTIPDANGARIAGIIGGDGGFVYAAGTCGAGLLACGSNGAWSANPTAYGYTAASVAQGQIASRTYIAADQQSNVPWLARYQIDFPVVGSPVYNTMATDLYLNQAGTVSSGSKNSIWGSKTGNGYGGRLRNFNFGFFGNNDISGLPDAAQEAPTLTLNGPTVDATPGSPSCTASKIDTSVSPSQFVTDAGATCHPALLINGNQATTGIVQANVLWANSFIYSTPTGVIGSDFRIKKDISPINMSLSDIMKLKPVIFRYKQNNKEQMGFIAQDIEKIFPTMVLTSATGTLGVEYNQLFAPLVSAVQELKKQNDAMLQELKVQQNLIQEMQNQLHKN